MLRYFSILIIFISLANLTPAQNGILVGYKGWGISFGEVKLTNGINLFLSKASRLTNGCSIGLFNSSSDIQTNGLSLSIIGNSLYYSRINGFHCSIFNLGYESTVNGLNLSLFNWSTESSKSNGITVFAFCGHIDELNGFSISPSFISSESGCGLSIAPLNFSTIKGFSIGLINFNDSSIQIGILNLSSNGSLGFPIINWK